jgi:hypothetical protein
MFNTGHMRSTGFPPLSDGRAGGSLTAAGSGWWLDEGKTVGSVACDLDLTEAALREWVTRARTDRRGGKTGLKTTEAKSSPASGRKTALLALRGPWTFAILSPMGDQGRPKARAS